MLQTHLEGLGEQAVEREDRVGNLSHFIAYTSVHKHLPFEQNSAQLLTTPGTGGKRIFSGTLW